ncbi:heme lyase CcmF/NrfE family subunit [Moraxella osloensis]|uniref:Cytochrome c-type biogenesis protein CcmF n=1 Tax=Faucicola osloensis TaxID=34062 RepID=A0A378Q8W8_FAUOS|nr:heme lyase CcmF/NrfE family subunit [Moraxella osloensis]AME00725.1 cytochrome C biogenesis protein CcmF [Moraxella osloensis]OBX54674.1 heme lyase CcmF/NrfE family subunit [Moraxella osloensis]QPT41680.1 heme lyase CcmF/NrfE family subunit [Moraxella osloensis]STY97251.1 Cytochrome c-type biogenesis protein CcmF [Moraxella osloensis]
MLITELGYFALISALVIAILQVILPAVGVFKHQPAWQRLAGSLAIAQFLATGTSFLCLMYGFYANDFTLIYVANQSNSLLPWYYRLSATWGGHEGSLLLWVTILAAWGAAVAVFSRSLPLAMRARVLVVISFVQMMMLSMVIFVSSPFNRSLPSIPVDGKDLNPLLQDPGLIFHPPMLYMGYVGAVVPFAFAMAALWAGRLDAVWTRWSRPWTLAAWCCLTLGIVFGSMWAYNELGWGGWWFWDPVENASLLPWLGGVALLHSLAVTEKRGVFKAWTIMLAIFTFALSLLGTFLVRSGVITSVHSFAADPTRGLFILVILGVVIGGGLALFAWRGWRLTQESHYQLKSRETLLVINNIIILVATIVVVIGTLYPMLADALKLGQVSVGAPYFNALFVPLTWLLLLFLAIGPVSRWKKDTRPFLGTGLAILASCFVLAGVLSYFLVSSIDINIFMSAALCLWVLVWMVIDIKDKTRNARSFGAGLKRLHMGYWGMQLAHLGILLSVMGIAITTSLSIEKDIAMQKNQSVEVQGYQFTMDELKKIRGANFDATQAVVSVRKNNQLVATLYPEKRHYVVSQMPMTEASIQYNPLRDIYMAMGEPILGVNQTEDDADKWAVRIYIKPGVRWVWWGGFVLALGAILSMFDKRYRKLPRLADMNDNKSENLAAINTAAAIAPVLVKNDSDLGQESPHGNA